MSGVYLRRSRALLRRARAAAGAEAVLVTSPENVRYLSGFTGEDSWLVVAPGRRMLITDTRFEEEAEKSCPTSAVHIRTGPMTDETAAILRWLGKKCAYESDNLTVSQRDSLVKAVGGGRTKGRGRLVGAVGLVESLRIVKDASEIKAIALAVRIAQRAFRRALAESDPDDSESAFAAALEYLMRSEGAQGAAFPTIVATEPASSLPHAKPSRRKLGASPTVLVDWGARVAGYNSDLTRVIARGKVSPRMAHIYRVAWAAQKAAIKAVKPGVTAARVDGVARKVIADAGFGEFFGHGLGHGVGLQVHEGPTLSRRSSMRLRSGMVVTVEPGIYLPGEGGVRVEDMVLVTGRGAKLLTHVSRDPGRLGGLPG